MYPSDSIIGVISHSSLQSILDAKNQECRVVTVLSSLQQLGSREVLKSKRSLDRSYQSHQVRQCSQCRQSHQIPWSYQNYSNHFKKSSKSSYPQNSVIKNDASAQPNFCSFFQDLEHLERERGAKKLLVNWLLTIRLIRIRSRIDDLQSVNWRI